MHGPTCYTCYDPGQVGVSRGGGASSSRSSAGHPRGRSWRARSSRPIGFLDLRSPEALTDRLRGFRLAFRESGFVEGDNVTVVQSTTKATTVYSAAPGDLGLSARWIL